MKAKRFFRIIAAVVTAVTLFASFPVYAEGEWPGEDYSMTEMDSVVRNIEDIDELSDNQKNAEIADISQEEFILVNPEYVEIDDISLEEFVLQNSSSIAIQDGVTSVSAEGWTEVTENGRTFWVYIRYGSRLTGWQKIDSYWYYFLPSGEMVHGWLQLTENGKKVFYYMGRPNEPDSGAMYTGGWLHDVENASDWYYFGTDGQMRTRWLEVSGETYYLGTSGKMVTGTVNMSPYVRSTFNSSGALAYDTMIPKNPIQYTDNYGIQTYYPPNVRWDNLKVVDSNRVAVATINGDEIDGYFAERPVDNALSYYGEDATSWISLSPGSKTSANIILKWFDYSQLNPSDYLLMYSRIAAITYCRDPQGRWIDGLSAPEVTAPSYNTGTIVQSYIYVNLDMQDESTTVGEITPYQVDVVIKHEIGHAFGLRHTFEKDITPDPGVAALMYPHYDVEGKAVNTFQPYDIVELSRTYP